MIEALSSRFSISLLIACAAHILVLFGSVSSGQAPPQAAPILRITLATQPTTTTAASSTIAISHQRGANTASAALALAANHSPDTAAGTTRKNTTQPNTVAILARPTEQANVSNQPTPADASKGRPGNTQFETQTVHTQSAHADQRAAYLDAWRRIVERIGNHKLPDTLVQRSAGKSLTLEVALNANGDIIDMRVRHSSGSLTLDAAAQRVLREAAPFTAFSEALRAHYKNLRFAYDWRFVSSQDAAD